jgi:hypothetical protein
MPHRSDCPAENKPFLDDADIFDYDSLNNSRTSMAKKFPTWIVHILFIVIYSAMYVVFIARQTAQHTTSLHPINDLKIKVVASPYDDFEKSPYAGPPSPSVDSAWHHLLEYTTIRVTAEELLRSNQSSVALPGGGYMAWLGVFHELHCIKMVRQWAYRDHYHPNITAEEIEEWSIHADHCLDILRSAALCHADTTLTTFGWANKSKPMLNTRPINHKCIDWNGVRSSVKDRIVGREEMSKMVNPNFL